ncbi:MAG: class II aldolase/adducin family protein [Deltaproteobacteria bacterium]|nr:class II aldolase/adducin family protein [Deltaproteobacteria bacterium]
MITAIGEMMRECYSRGWITTRDGNCSLRRKESKFVYITPSGWRKNLIYPELMVRMTLTPDKTLKIPEGAHPSGELHMHYLILKDAPATRAIVHTHPTHVIAAMYRGFDLQFVATQFPEIFRYTRVGPTVPPIAATTRELGEATAKALGVSGSSMAFDIVGQSNHGVCAVGDHPWSAFEHIERLDHICEILLASGVTPEEVRDRKVLK